MLTEEQIDKIAMFECDFDGSRKCVNCEFANGCSLQKMANQAKQAISLDYDKMRLYAAIYELLEEDGWNSYAKKQPTKEDGTVVVYGMRHNDFCDKKIYETDWDDCDCYPYVVTYWKRKEG